MNLLQLVLHLKSVLQVGQDIKQIVDNLVSGKEKFPSEDEFLKVFDDLVSFITAGVINLGGNEQKALDVVSNLKLALHPVELVAQDAIATAQNIASGSEKIPSKSEVSKMLTDIGSFVGSGALQTGPENSKKVSDLIGSLKAIVDSL